MVEPDLASDRVNPQPLLLPTVPGLSLQTSGFVLQKPPDADRFQQVTLFSQDRGHLLCFQRLSAKQPTAPFDLFDEIGGTLTSSNQGRTWFFTEWRMLRRFTGIGLNFVALREASSFAAVLVRNPLHEDSRERVYALLGTALQAWSDGARPDIVGLKALYTLARDEGYPVKEDWAASLRGTDRDAARNLLNQPLAATADTEPAAAARLLESLRRYLRGHFEFLID